MRDPERRDATIAVTGLTGFIGRRLQPQLLDLGLSVRALLRPGRTVGDLDPRCSTSHVSLDDVAGLSKALEGVECVVHLAGSVRGAKAGDFRMANIDAVTNICEAIDRQPGSPAFLLISSFVAKHPELSHYASSKRSGEQTLMAYQHLDWTVLRPPAVYGPGDREMRGLLKCIRLGFTVIPGNPNQSLALLHVDDVASAITTWVKDPQRCRHGTFAIDDGRPGGYGWTAITEAVGTRSNRTIVVPVGLLNALGRANLILSRCFAYAPMLTPAKVRELTFDRWVGDGNAYNAVTGWQPRYNLASGVAQMFGQGVASSDAINSRGDG